MERIELSRLAKMSSKELSEVLTGLNFEGRSKITKKADKISAILGFYKEQDFKARNVVIPVTAGATIAERFSGLDMASHAAMSKGALRRTLYSVGYVVKMGQITGEEEGELEASACNVVAGNSPVLREVYSWEGGERKSLSLKVVANLDKEGNIDTFRDVICDTELGCDKSMNYHSLDTVAQLKFEFKNNFNKTGRAANKALLEKVVAKGVSFVPDANGIERPVLGKVEGYPHFTPLIWTPSNERNGQMMLTSLNGEEKWKLLESIGGGTVGKLLAKGEMPMKKFIKLASRLGLFATPAVKFGKVGTQEHGVLILSDSLKGDDDFNEEYRNILKSVNVNVDREQWDGAAYFSARYAKDALKQGLGLNVVASEALMFAFQLRVTGVYAKVFGEAVHQSVMDKIVAYVKANYIEGVDYIIVGDASRVSMVLDSNAAKLIDLEKQKKGVFQVYLLDIAKGTQSRTSTQMLDKFSVKDHPLVKAYLMDVAEKEGDDFVNSIGNYGSDLLSATNNNVAQTLIHLAKAFPGSSLASEVDADLAIMSELAKELAIKQEAAFRKCAVKIPSIFQRAIFEISHLITDGKLDSLLQATSKGAIECYSTDVLEMNQQHTEELEEALEKALEEGASELAESLQERLEEESIKYIEGSTLSREAKDVKLENILTAGMVKYPTPGREEIEYILFLTPQQIAHRLEALVKAGTITAEESKVLFNYFITTSYGTIKIAATNAIKIKLAGMDTDYDGVSVILDRKLVSILERIFLERRAEIECATGLLAAYGGSIPFINAAKKKEVEAQMERCITSIDDSTEENIFSENEEITF